ncbi:MAG: hypothetical protein KAR42_10460 [candidate division Zixibacteria bacterium]|nr:hypothetical protein [candidate division Zixibacteria bacterium]
MRRTAIILFMGLCALIVMVGDKPCNASSYDEIEVYLEIKIEPRLPLTKGEPITLDYSINVPDKYKARAKKNASVRLLAYSKHSGEKDTLELRNVEIGFDDNYFYSGSFQISLPNDKISLVNIYVQTGRIEFSKSIVFETRGDNVLHSGQKEFLTLPPAPKYGKPLFDTMTVEQLQTEYEVILNLKDPSKRKTIEKVIGPIPESSVFDKQKYEYKVTTSLESILDMGKQGIRGRFTTPPPWERDQLLKKKMQDMKTDSIDTDSNSPPPQ